MWQFHIIARWSHFPVGELDEAESGHVCTYCAACISVTHQPWFCVTAWSLQLISEIRLGYTSWWILDSTALCEKQTLYWSLLICDQSYKQEPSKFAASVEVYRFWWPWLIWSSVNIKKKMTFPILNNSWKVRCSGNIGLLCVSVWAVMPPGSTIHLV